MLGWHGIMACGLVVGTDPADIHTLRNTRRFPDSDISVSVNHGDMVWACKFSVELILMLRQHTEVCYLHCRQSENVGNENFSLSTMTGFIPV